MVAEMLTGERLFCEYDNKFAIFICHWSTNINCHWKN